MKNWKKSDIGKVIVYRGELGRNEEVAIYGVDSKVPNTLGVIDCPIPLYDSPIALKSKINITGIVKDNKQKGEEYLEKEGDWYFKRYASKEEKKVLKKVAKDIGVFLDKD